MWNDDLAEDLAENDRISSGKFALDENDEIDFRDALRGKGKFFDKSSYGRARTSLLS